MAGYIKVKDVMNKVTVMKLPYADDLAKLKSFANSLDSYTNGQCTEVGIYQAPTVDTPTASAATDGKLASVEHKAHAKFSYVDANVKYYLDLVIPAPDDDGIEEVEKTGYRFVESQGTAIAAMLSTLTGKTVKYENCYFTGKRTQSQM